jgi:peptide/nickel transport system substrate-binding protein
MDAAALRILAQRVARGQLSRRRFIARLAALGVTAPMAQAVLAQAGVAPLARNFRYAPTRAGGGGALRLLLWQAPTLLNNHFATGVKDQLGSRVFYEPLITYDNDGAPVPVLAAELPTRANGGVSDDGRTVTWRLKPGVKWHDGQPFTADDVVFNWRYATDPAMGAFTSGSYLGIASTERVDALTVRVVYTRPNPDPLGAWAINQLLPRHLFAPYMGARAREAPANLRPVGTGPYRFVDFRPGDMLRGERNPDYHVPNRPHFDTLELKGGGDAVGAARAVLQTGEYDFAWQLLVEDEVLQRLERGGRGRLEFRLGGTTEFVMLNVADPWTEHEGERAHPDSRHPVFSDARVREALALLIDRAAIERFVYGRTGPATANKINNPAIYRSPNQRMLHDPTRAEVLLEEAGWRRAPGDRNGLRHKDGRPLKLLFTTSTSAPRQKVQAVLKQACQRAGIELELKSVTPAVFFSSDVANPDTAAKFWCDMQMYARTQGPPDPRGLMGVYCSWERASRANNWNLRNNLRWADAEYDRLYLASEAELDPARRAAMFIAMNDRLCNSRYLIPMVQRPQVSALANTLRAPLSAWGSEFAFLQDWHRAG